jgi:pimeloyl-ACP methyl ester carboxylesterase
MLELAFSRLASHSGAPEVLIVGPSLGTAVRPLWAECATLLQDRFEVVGWDLPGHGKSPAADGPFRIEDLAARVRLEAEAIAEGRPSWYAGVSLSGAVGFELAIEPGPLRGIAALGSGPKIGEPSAWGDRARLVREAGTQAMLGPSAGRWFHPTFADREHETAKTLLESLEQTDGPSYAWACEALAAFDRRPSVRQEKVKVLLANGSNDVVIPPAEANDSVRSAPKVTFRVVPDCGHLPPAEQPGAVASLLRDAFAAQREQGSQRLFGDLHHSFTAGAPRTRS